MYIYMELKINDKFEVLFNVFGKFLYKYWNISFFESSNGKYWFLVFYLYNVKYIKKFNFDINLKILWDLFLIFLYIFIWVMFF